MSGCNDTEARLAMTHWLESRQDFVLYKIRRVSIPACLRNAVWQAGTDLAVCALHKTKHT